ncbi:MAG: response regulator transcription factor [Saprospiraceae bacterium]|nr:response regulator transcription factor [Candidatus Vicinibacter affinis]
MEQIRYAIADDHPVFISGLVTNLNRYQDLTFVFAAKDGDELIYKLKFKENHVDVILLDIKMPKMSGLAALQTIRQNDPTVRIIILTGTEDDSYIFKMIEEKANSYLIKNSETSEIYQAIINCMELGFYFPEYVKDALLNKEVRKNRLNPKESKQYIELTLREKRST